MAAWLLQCPQGDQMPLGRENIAKAGYHQAPNTCLSQGKHTFNQPHLGFNLNTEFQY